MQTPKPTRRSLRGRTSAMLSYSSEENSNDIVIGREKLLTANTTHSSTTSETVTTTPSAVATTPTSNTSPIPSPIVVSTPSVHATRISALNITPSLHNNVSLYEEIETAKNTEYSISSRNVQSTLGLESPTSEHIHILSPYSIGECNSFLLEEESLNILNCFAELYELHPFDDPGDPRLEKLHSGQSGEVVISLDEGLEDYCTNCNHAEHLLRQAANTIRQKEIDLSCCDIELCKMRDIMDENRTYVGYIAQNITRLENFKINTEQLLDIKNENIHSLSGELIKMNDRALLLENELKEALEERDHVVRLLRDGHKEEITQVKAECEKERDRLRARQEQEMLCKDEQIKVMEENFSKFLTENAYLKNEKKLLENQLKEKVRGDEDDNIINLKEFYNDYTHFKKYISKQLTSKKQQQHQQQKNTNQQQQQQQQQKTTSNQKHKQILLL